MFRTRLSTLGWLASTVLAASTSTYAATGEIRLRTGSEPGTACVSTPNTIDVQLQVAALSHAVNGVQARISYDTSRLSLSIPGSTEAAGWTRILLNDSAGLVTYALVNNGGSSGPGAGPFTVATL